MEADCGLQSPICQSDAVDDGPVLREPEDAGTRIPRLRPRRDGSDLYESESQCGEFAIGFAVAVESGGQPDGVLEPDAEDFALEEGMFHGVAFMQQPAPSGDQPDEAQKEHDDAMRPLDGEREQQRFYELTIHIAGKGSEKTDTLNEASQKYSSR